MIFNHCFSPAEHNHNFSNAAVYNFFNNILNSWLVHYGKHFLWHRFSSRQYSCTIACSENYCFFYFHMSPQNFKEIALTMLNRKHLLQSILKMPLKDLASLHGQARNDIPSHLYIYCVYFLSYVLQMKSIICR